MAGPLYRAIGTRAQSASAATLSPAKPTVDGQNGLLLAVVTSKNNDTHSTATSGWALVGQVNSGASFTASLWKAAETAAAPTFTWSSAAACSARIGYYSDPANVVDTTLGATSSSNGTANPHTSTAITTTRANSDVIYVDVAAANTTLAQPSGWVEDSDGGSATDAGQTTFGSKSVATSGSSSGAISVTGAAAAWVQWQVEVMGQAGTSPSLQTSKIEVGAWEEPLLGFTSSKIEVGAWLDAPTEASFSKLEVGVWLEYVGTSAGRRRFLAVNC